MLSNSAFNAMLKTLEEPPEHVKFILATTDPQKIPVTVLSRCLQFNLKQMSPATIAERLGEILAAEKIDADPAALRQLAKAAAGSMRDALSLLDQAIAHGGGRIEDAAVRDMLGTVGEEHVFEIVDGLAATDAAAMLSVAERMDERSLSFDSALQELATLFHRIALLQFVPDAVGEAAERTKLEPYARRFDPEFLQLAYQIAVQGREQLALAPDEATGFAMTLLRLFAFRPTTPAALPANGAGAVKSGGGARAEGVLSSMLPAQPVAAAGARPAPVTPPAPTVAAATGDWHDVVAGLPVSGMVRQLAQHCELAEIDDNAIFLRLPPAHKHLAGRAHQDKLQAELQNHYGRPLKLNIVLADAETETPAQRNRNVQRERQERAIASIEADGFVRDVVDMFDASIDESSIKPV
jgi:DNA polymerase-3 subunit gamma/tau